jgi:Neuraminidase (sialidase)
MIRLSAGALLLALAAVSLTSSAHAADSCQPLFDALIKVANTPNHSYTTSTAVNGTPTVAETIFANGQKYIRVREKWLHIPVTSQHVAEQEKEKEQHGTSSCRVLRNEAVNGDPATLYSVHREYDQVKEDGQIWVSKSSGLLLRAEEDVSNEGNKVKEHRSTRFEYDNVRPPI